MNASASRMAAVLAGVLLIAQSGCEGKDQPTPPGNSHDTGGAIDSGIGGRAGAGDAPARGGSTTPTDGGSSEQNAGGSSGSDAKSQGGEAGGSIDDRGVSGSSAGGADTVGGSGSSGGAPLIEGGAPARDCAARARGLTVIDTWDEFGYPSYTLDACQLAYVGADGSLRLRDLRTQEEELLETAEARPRRPTLNGAVLAWEVVIEQKPQVKVRSSEGIVTLSGDFDHAGEPVAAADAVVFTAFRTSSPNSDSDVLIYDTMRLGIGLAIGGPGQQRFADISEDYVAATDFSEDPRGYFDEQTSVADIILYSRHDGSVFSRPRPGKQAFPMLGQHGELAYLDWAAVHPEPKFGAFRLLLGLIDDLTDSDLLVRSIETDPSYVRPSLRGGFLDYVDRSTGAPLLYRSPISDPSAATSLRFENSLVPLGPLAGDTFTLLATRGVGGVGLEVIAR